MLTNKELMSAKRAGDWIVIHLNRLVRGNDHCESLAENVKVNWHNKTLYGWCPCDGVRFTIPFSNITLVLRIPQVFAPHKDLAAKRWLKKVHILVASKYCELKTNFVNKDTLIECLEEIYGKGNVEWHEVATNLYGYSGKNDIRKEVANIIIRKKYVGSASNDLGFVKTANGTYSMVVSQYDKGSHFNTKKQNALKQAYAVKTIQKVSNDKRYYCAAPVIVGGKTKLVVTV